MRKLVILFILICFVGGSVFVWVNSRNVVETSLVSQKQPVVNRINPNRSNTPSTESEKQQIRLKNKRIISENRNNISDEVLVPENDPASPYYLQENTHQQLSSVGLFNEKAAKKLFEIRRKMIDRDFDSRNMVAELRRKLQESQNGKLSQKEILGLLPEDLVSDFEDMIHLMIE